MGQITNPSAKGITVNPTDRETGPGAGGGQTGNNVLFLGLNAGANSSIANAVGLGTGALSAGVTDTHLNGSVAIGVGSLSALTTGDGSNHPVTVIGENNFPALVNAGNLVVLGNNNFLAYTNVSTSNIIVIGNNNFPGGTGLGSNNNTIYIGSGIGTAVSGSISNSNSIFIGSNINDSSTSMGYTNMIVLGNNISASVTAGSASVWIGNNATVNTAQPGSSVYIGNAWSEDGNNAGDDRNVCIGSGVVSSGVQNVVIGQQASSPATRAQTVGNVCIGCGAGQSFLANTQGQLVIEEYTTGLGAGLAALVYGSFLTGNIVLGTSVQGTNRDFAGTSATNILKLLNGTVGNANPIGGGYFYVTGGILRWVDPTGTNTQLSMSAAGQLAGNAVTAYTNNAAGNVGTLTNSPTTGNPTKWIPINDNGTIRNIPAW